MGDASAPKVGDRAPDFSLPSGNGKTVRLGDFIGKKTVVLYFYPKDDTYGCTMESCSFRDHYADFVDAGAEVIGVSGDSLESHDKFASKHRLPFTLLSDTSGEVRARYGVRALFGLLPGRFTFVIDCEGIVRYVFTSNVRFNEHVESALNVVRSLEKTTGAPAQQA